MRKGPNSKLPAVTKSEVLLDSGSKVLIGFHPNQGFEVLPILKQHHRWNTANPEPFSDGRVGVEIQLKDPSSMLKVLGKFVHEGSNDLTGATPDSGAIDN
jgi:hypothetical protein